MARRLDTLDPGTPVFAGETRVGVVRGVYAEGESRVPELLVVGWESRGQDVAVPTDEVGTVDDRGVTLIQTEPGVYDDLSAFEPSRYPTVRRLT